MVHENENEYEHSINYNLVDLGAGITTKPQIVKIRKLNRAIIESLKLLYDYRCQICGNDFSARYGVHISESHHIKPFTKSLNNDASNQIIICPNHHRIIHKAEPVFDYKTLTFRFSNNIEDGLILNRHLTGSKIS
jgi:5-methylcytosine-specific restriction enzyme A